MNLINIIGRFRRNKLDVTRSEAVAAWPYTLGNEVRDEKLKLIQARLDMLEKATQYGWGHTIDFGPFQKSGILGTGYLQIAALLDSWAWWPMSLDGYSVADIGCFTGGLTLLMAARQPKVVYAIDEIAEHIDQCKFLCDVFGVPNVTHVQTSLYRVCDHIEENSLDIVLMSGVLYHPSDMLTGLLILRNIMKPGGLLIIESDAVNDERQSYANFGRFYAGMWWQPSSLCVKDICQFMGFARPEIRFYKESRLLARTTRLENKDIPFKRGLNWQFDSMQDAQPRSLDAGVMAPVRY